MRYRRMSVVAFAGLLGTATATNAAEPSPLTLCVGADEAPIAFDASVPEYPLGGTIKVVGPVHALAAMASGSPDNRFRCHYHQTPSLPSALDYPYPGGRTCAPLRIATSRSRLNEQQPGLGFHRSSCWRL